MWRTTLILCLLSTPASACLTAGSGAKCATAADSLFGIGAADLNSGGAKFQKAPERVYPVKIGDTLSALKMSTIVSGHYQHTLCCVSAVRPDAYCVPNLQSRDRCQRANGTSGTAREDL